MDPNDIPDLDVRKWYKKKINGIDKFHTVRKLKIDQDLIPEISWKQDLSLALIYCVWSQPLYFNLLFVSLISQLKWTDIRRTTVFLFVSEELYDSAIELFSKFNIKIVKIECTFNKYSVVDHPALQSFQKIVVCDCDTFTFGCKRHRFYAKLSNSTNSILMMDEPDSALKVFYDRKCLIEPSLIESDEFYAHCWSKILGKDVTKIIPKTKWYLSCMGCFDSSIFASEEWRGHVKQALEMGTWCDETVFLTFAWANGIPVQTLETLPNVRIARIHHAFEAINSPGLDLCLLHPLHGKYCEDNRVGQIYDVLLEEITESDNSVYMCFALQRSGYHAIINWIRSHLDDSGYLNDRIATDYKMDEVDVSTFLSFENQNIVAVDSPRKELDYYILILRDPFNCFASQFMMEFNKSGLKVLSVDWRAKVETWKQHALEFLGDTNIVKNKLCVNYNEWFSSVSYRAKLSEFFNGNPNDTLLDMIPTEGGGSSFDFRRFNGRARSMTVLERWKQVDPLIYSKYRDTLMFDPEIINLARRVFGDAFVEYVIQSEIWTLT